MAYLGNSPQQKFAQKYFYTATAGQTTFSGTDIYGLILKYEDSKYIDVYLNGSKLQLGEDYTATSRTSVVLASGAQLGDILEIDVQGIFTVADTVSASAGGTFASAINVNSNLAVTGNINTNLLVVGNNTSNTRVTNNSIIFSDNSQISTAQSLGMRNRIINGGMAIDQRNAGANLTFTAAAALAYSVDRWYGYCTGANVIGRQVAGTGANQYMYRFAGASSVTAIGFGQRIEQLNCYDMANTTVTLSADLQNSLLTTVTWTAYYANTADTFGTLASPTRTQISNGTFTVSNTMSRYSTNINIPAAANTGLEIVLSVGAQTSGYWNIGAVQLESSNTATPFERRLYGQELTLCQRFYQQSNGDINGRGYIGGGVFHFPIMFPTVMRTTPTASVTNFTNITQTSGCVPYYTNAWGLSFRSTSTASTDFEYTARYTASAEL